MIAPEKQTDASTDSLLVNKAQLLASKPHKQAWLNLRYSLEQGAGLVLLSGPEGMGKTSLLKVLRQDFQQQSIKTVFLSAVNIGKNDLLKTLVESINPKISQGNPQDHFKYLSDIQRFLPMSMKRIVMFIDDAENLSPSDLVELTKILSHKQLLEHFQVVLCGNQDLQLMLSLKEFAALKQRLAVSHELLPMSAQDSIAFVLRKIKSTEPLIDITPDIAQINNIIELSQGNPQLINNNLDNLAFNLACEADKIILNRTPELKDAEKTTPSEIVSDENIVNDYRLASETKSNPFFNKDAITTGLISYLFSALIIFSWFSFYKNPAHDTSTKTSQLATQKIEQQPHNVNMPARITNAPPSLRASDDEKDIRIDNKLASNATVQTPDSATLNNSEQAKKPVTQITEKTAQPKLAINNLKLAAVPETSVIASTVKSSKPANSQRPATIQTSENKKTAIEQQNQPPEAKVATIATANANIENSTPQRFKRNELNKVVLHFEDAYQAGDIKQIERLVSHEVTSNDIDGKKSFITAYKKLFNITTSRKIQFLNLTWDESDQSIIGKGAFKVTLYERGSTLARKYSGSIFFHVENRDDELKISKIVYSYTNL